MKMNEDIVSNLPFFTVDQKGGRKYAGYAQELLNGRIFVAKAKYDSLGNLQSAAGYVLPRPKKRKRGFMVVEE